MGPRDKGDQGTKGRRDGGTGCRSSQATRCPELGHVGTWALGRPLGTWALGRLGATTRATVFERQNRLPSRPSPSCLHAAIRHPADTPRNQPQRPRILCEKARRASILKLPTPLNPGTWELGTLGTSSLRPFVPSSHRPFVPSYLSASPITGSIAPMIATTSEIIAPVHIGASA
jgi:hypothetical protein